MSWNQAWGLTPERTWPNAARELCWDQVDSAKQSGISDVGWKWEEEQAQWSGKELLQCAPASTDTQVCGSQRMSLFQIRSERMCLLRRAFAREAYSHTDKLRTLSDNTLRHRLNFPTLESATREQRMIWYQSTLARPSHHTLYLATFFGFFEWENVPDLKLNGSLSHRALPALGQLADDLTRLLPCGLGFVWGWVPAILEQDLSGVSRFDSIPRAVPVPASVMVPVSSEPFVGSNLHQCSECKANFFTRVGMFLHKTKVSTIIVHFKGNTCPRCKSIFSSEKSANDHYRRNLKRKTCAKPRSPEASHVLSRRPASSPPKIRGNIGTQQTLFGVFGFATQGDRGEKRSLAHSGRGKNSRGGRGAGSKSLPKPESGERTNHIQWVREE